MPTVSRATSEPIVDSSDDEKETVFMDVPENRRASKSNASDMSLSESKPKRKVPDDKTVVMITGCSSGVGKELILNLIKDESYIIFATMRNKKSPKGMALMRECEDAEAMLNILELDVSKADQIDAAVKRVLQLVGRVDILINNAGYGTVGPVEVQPMNEIKDMFETNFYGALSLIKRLVPGMRERQRGRIINITGIHGATGRPFEACYSASKFALEGLTASMAPVYKKFGVHFSTICPGDVTTEFGRNQKQPALSVNKATGHMDWSNVPKDLMEPFGTYLCSSMLARKTQAQGALEVVRVILRCIKAENPHLRYETSTDTTVKKAFEIARGTDRNGDRLLAFVQANNLAERARAPAPPAPAHSRRRSIFDAAKEGGASLLRRASTLTLRS